MSYYEVTEWKAGLLTRRLRKEREASIGAYLFTFQDHLHLQELIYVRHTHNIFSKLDKLDKPSLDVISCSSSILDIIYITDYRPFFYLRLFCCHQFSSHCILRTSNNSVKTRKIAFVIHFSTINGLGNYCGIWVIHSDQRTTDISTRLTWLQNKGDVIACSDFFFLFHRFVWWFKKLSITYI